MKMVVYTGELVEVRVEEMFGKEIVSVEMDGKLKWYGVDDEWVVDRVWNPYLLEMFVTPIGYWYDV